MKNIKVIAFDADDTLWENENYYRDTEMKFCELMSSYLSIENVRSELLNTEMANIELYGYGAKSFVLSMIETYMRISTKKVEIDTLSKIIQLGKDLIDMPIVLLKDVESTLSDLFGKYQLILATKGDLLDQHRKLSKSGLAKYFCYVEVMSNKKKEDYLRLIQKVGVSANEFLMIGNTIKSDIIPVIEIGGKAIHIPYHITWEHEKADIGNTQFIRLENFSELKKLLLY